MCKVPGTGLFTELRTVTCIDYWKFPEKDYTNSPLGHVPRSYVWHHACGGKGAPPSLAGGSANKEERLHVRRREQGSHPAIH
jgi:hypothetical protein